MKYSIVGSGLVGNTLGGIFARHGVEVHIANSRGPASLAAITAELGPDVIRIYQVPDVSCCAGVITPDAVAAPHVVSMIAHSRPWRVP
jgi:predicted dinucleotide-binding enzyme